MLLTALRRAGIKVPTLCHIDGLTATGACRMCVVEVEGQRGLVPSCAFPVGRRHEGPDALAARRAGPQDDRRAAAGQPSRRLPVLRPQRQLRAAAAGRGTGRPRSGASPATARGTPSTPPAPRSSAIRPSASSAASACGCARRSSAWRPSTSSAAARKAQDRHGLRRGPERVELRQLRPVHHGLPDRRAGRAEPDQGSARRPARPGQAGGRAARPGRLGHAGRGVRHARRAPTSPAR